MAKLAAIFERRWLRRTLYAVGATLVVLVLALWLGGPPALRWAIETVGSRELGRTLRAGEIHVNPFTLTVRIADFTIEGAPDESEPLLTIGEVRTNVAPNSIWHRAPVIGSLLIDRIRAHIVRLDAQRFNFSDIVERQLAKPEEEKPPSSEPARFAVNNIDITNSSIHFDDKLRAQTNTLEEIHIAIPFISSLPTDLEIFVKPAFFARLDGQPIEVNGETRPFKESREASVNVKLEGLDVPKYLSFSPVPLKFQVPRGALDADLHVVFRHAAAATAKEPAQAAELLISGPVALREFELVAPTGANARRLLAWRRLGVAIEEYSVFGNRLRLSEVALEAPEVDVTRDAAGRLNWVEFAAAPVASTTSGQAPAPAESAAAKAPPALPFDAAVAALRISDGRVRFTDATAGNFVKQLDAIAIEGHDMSTVAEQPATVKLTAHSAGNETFGAEGEMHIAKRAGKIAVTGKGIDVEALAPYLAAAVRGRIEARVDAGATVEFDAAATPLALRANDINVTARKVLVEGPSELGAKLDVATLAAEGASVDLGAQSVEVPKITIDAPHALVTRLADGSIGWAGLATKSKSPDEAAPGKQAGDAAAGAPAAKPWRVHIAAADLSKGHVQFTDRAINPEVIQEFSALTVKARDITADGSTPAQVDLRGRVGKDGTIAVDGNVRWDQLAATLKIDARNIDLAVTRAYIAKVLNVEFASAEVSTSGALKLATAGAKQTIDYRGDARVANLHLLNPGGSGDLLKWSLLSLERCAVRLGDGLPVIEIGAVALSDFFARVVLSEGGRLNLQDVRETEPSATSEPKPEAKTEAKVDANPASRELPAVIRIGGITLERGNVNYTDNFVKPNYTANLTNFGGTVGAISSDNPALADLDVKAQLDNDAPVQIKGKVNPLAPQLSLDIAASAKGVDLPRFTPYSAKYAGYPITKGKLTLDVTYKVDQGKLTATNKLFLDQLTFGEHVDSPSATKLPVLFAVSLLKNSRGEINLNVPISGSLNDPQFSVGAVIIQVIVNLITKAVTAPFALLASAFGGGEELGYVEFEPGSAVIAESQQQRLTTLAKALNDRPALRLDVIGRVDPDKDTEALRTAKYEAKLRAAKVRDVVRSGGASVDPASIKIDPAERPALIGRVYDAEKLPDKPRNFLGIAKSIPAAEMEKMLLAATTVTPEDLRNLANARSDAVRHELEGTGGVAGDRMFLVEPKLTPEGIKDKGATTRVDFSIK